MIRHPLQAGVGEDYIEIGVELVERTGVQHIEIAPTTGTPHLQMLMCATNSGCTAERVLKAWPAADIEVVRDFSGAVDYIYKRGEYADKAFTQIVPARAMDNELVPNPQRSRRNKEKNSDS